MYFFIDLFAFLWLYKKANKNIVKHIDLLCAQIVLYKLTCLALPREYVCFCSDVYDTLVAFVKQQHITWNVPQCSFNIVSPEEKKKVHFAFRDIKKKCYSL